MLRGLGAIVAVVLAIIASGPVQARTGADEAAIRAIVAAQAAA